MECVQIIILSFRSKIGLDRTVVSIVHCGCTDPGSIPGLDKRTIILRLFLSTMNNLAPFGTNRDFFLFTVSSQKPKAIEVQLVYLLLVLRKERGVRNEESADM